MSRVRQHKRNSKHRKRHVRIGSPDPTLTGLAGLTAVEELTHRLGLVAALNRDIEPIMQRARGLTGGQLLVGLAIAQLVGQDCLAAMDRVRADAGTALLSAAPVAPGTTAGRLAGCSVRLDSDSGCRRGVR